MLRQFVAAEFKHGIGDNYYPDQVKTLTEIVDKWIKDGDYTTIPESIKEYFGTWVGEGYIRNTEHIAWKRLLSNNASAKWGENNAKQQEYAINLRNRLWTLCKLVEQAAKSKHHPLDPKNIDGYSQIMNSLEIFDKVHKELWPDHDLIPPPKLDGEQYTIDMGVDEPLSARARVAAIEERVSSQHNGQRRPSLHRRHFRRRSVVKTYKLVKLKKQIRTFIKEFKKLLNHPLAPAESIFMPAEPQIKGSEPGSKKNPFKNKKNALAECRKQIQDEGNSELNGDEAVINFGFVYVKLIKYWIIYINNYRTSPAPTATKLGNMNNKELREKADELGLSKEEVKRLANGANLSNNSTWMTGIMAHLAQKASEHPTQDLSDAERVAAAAQKEAKVIEAENNRKTKAAAASPAPVAPTPPVSAVTETAVKDDLDGMDLAQLKTLARETYKLGRHGFTRQKDIEKLRELIREKRKTISVGESKGESKTHAPAAKKFNIGTYHPDQIQNAVNGITNDGGGMNVKDIKKLLIENYPDDTTAINKLKGPQVRVRLGELAGITQEEQSYSETDSDAEHFAQVNSSSLLAPPGDLTNMLANMTDDWASSEDELQVPEEESTLEFAESSASEMKTSSGLEFAESSAMETDSGNEFSDGFEFAESSDVKMSSDFELVEFPDAKVSSGLEFAESSALETDSDAREASSDLTYAESSDYD